MGRTVDGRAARIDTDAVGAQRDERPRLARQRVVQPEASSDRLDRGDARAPRSTARRPRRRRDCRVEALTLTASRSSPRSVGDRVAHRVELSAEPRPGGDDRQVHAGRAPAGGLDPATDLVDQLRAGDAARRPVVGREEPSEVAQRRPPRAARRPAAWRTTSPSEWPASARGARDLDAAEAERHRPARTDGCRGRCPSASRRGPAEHRAPLAARSVGQRHLEVAGIAGHDMDRRCYRLRAGRPRR